MCYLNILIQCISIEILWRTSIDFLAWCLHTRVISNFGPKLHGWFHIVQSTILFIDMLLPMNSLRPFERGGKVQCMVIAIRKLLCLFLRISIFGIKKCDLCRKNEWLWKAIEASGNS